MTNLPIPPPPDFVDNPPFICIKVNANWRPVLIGLVRPMIYPEYWGGTLEENRQARRDAQNLIFQIMDASECGDMNECCTDVTVIKHQVNPETWRYEISVDGGQNWIPDPADPENGIIALPPPIQAGAMADKCDAASNGTQHIREIVQNMSFNLAAGLTIAELVAAIVSFLFIIILEVYTVGGATPVFVTALATLWAMVAAIFTLGKEEFDAYWVESRYDEIVCILFCNMSADATFTEAGYLKVISDFGSKMAQDIALDPIIGELKVMGRTGLNNLCAYGNAAIMDCDSCDCDACDFTNWEVVTGTFISQSNTEIVAYTEEVTPGQFYVTFRNPLINQCCCDLGALTDPETNPSALGVIPCGKPNDNQDFINFSYTGGSGNYWAARFPNACQVTLKGVAPEECD